MRILMVSPHPVYTPRGTPISVLNRCRALGALGHEIDLVTYPIGEDVAVDGLTYLRARVPGVRRVRVGPSWSKVPLNAAVALRTARELLRSQRAGHGRYDVIHTHEEAGLIGWALSGLTRRPHVYDMGNDWGTVLTNYGLRGDHPVTRAAAALERRVVRSADLVIAHFPSVADTVRAANPDTPVAVVLNLDLADRPTSAAVAQVRAGWPDGPIVVYTGTLESYQGVELLVEAVAGLAVGPDPVTLVVAGGDDAQQRSLADLATARGVGRSVIMAGRRPPGEIPAMLAAADVLVSPRVTGDNTPLKIFQYLRSGTPVVATAIASHTQVLSEGDAVLVSPTADGIRLGIASILHGRRGSSTASTCDRFGPAAYHRAVAAAYDQIAEPHTNLEETR